MEQFVLGIFQEKLSKYIQGFKKEQVNANLLNGKGEIHNVELNCEAVMEEVQKVTPYVKLERVHISKLSFVVSNWMNLRKAPILVDVERVTAVISEPLDYRVRTTARRRLRQVTQQELGEMIRQGLYQKRGSSYNLLDRILDNLTIEIGKLDLHFQAWGKFKTRRSGPWTPPELRLSLAGIRMVSVDELGQEGSPEQVWKHNHHRAHANFMIYKKLEMSDYDVALRPANSDQVVPIVSGKDEKLQVQIAMERRVKDGEWMSVQVDATVPSVNVEINETAVPLLAHVLAGVMYVLAKDRAFEDPLKPKEEDVTSSQGNFSITSAEGLMDTTDDDIVEVTEEGDPSLTAVDKATVRIEEYSSSSDSDNDEAPQDETTDEPASENVAQPTKALSQQLSTTTSSNIPERLRKKPVILLPNDIAIFDKITLSIAVHSIRVKGVYAGEQGYVECIAKGALSEAIWPKTTREKGGYVQASLACFTIHEMYEDHMQRIASGGILLSTTDAPEEVNRDEFFPLFEDRSIRPDPLALRHLFPAQALGIKTTVDFYKNSSSGVDEVHVLHEMGVDSVEMLFDSEALSRMVKFAANARDGGFDPRWHTGDWGDFLRSDMLVNRTREFDLDQYLQPTTQIFLDENELISSDLFNVTARMTKITICVAAPIKHELRSCAVVTRFDESMLTVSSALPRTMLSGKVGAAIHGEDSPLAGVVDFPNDQSDIAFKLESREDPSDRQRGKATSSPISTARLQWTFRGLSVDVKSTIANQSTDVGQQLMKPSDFTTLICFEGEPASSKDGSNIILFLSVQGHRIDITVDLDHLVGIMVTLLFHFRQMKALSLKLLELAERSMIPEFTESEVLDAPGSPAATSRLRKTVKGRRLLIRRQLRRSRNTGGLNVACSIQVAEVRCRLFCFRFLSSTDFLLSEEVIYSDIIELTAANAEFGAEGALTKSTRRLVGKASWSTLQLNARDNVSQNLSTFLSFDGSSSEDSGDTSIRIEELNDGERSWIALALESMGECHIYNNANHLEQTMWEILALLMKASMCEQTIGGNSFFPANTVGAYFCSLLPSLTTSVDVQLHLSTLLLDEQAIDNFLSRTIHNRCHGLFLSTSLRKVVVKVPSDAFGTDRVLPLSLTLDFSKLDMFAGYARDEVRHDDARPAVLDTLCRKGQTWHDTITRDLEGGLVARCEVAYGLSAIQSGDDQPHSIVDPSVFVLEHSKGVTATRSDPIHFNHAPGSGMLASCGTMAIESLRSINDALRTVRSLVTKAQDTYDVAQTGEIPRSGISRPNAGDVIVGSALSSVSMVSQLLEEAVAGAASYETAVRAANESVWRNLRTTRVSLFESAQTQLGALAAVANDYSGFLRFGTARQSGLRGTLVCSLVPYWVVARDSLLMIFSCPRDPRPVVILSLRGASLRSLAGGRRRDVRRAFAILEGGKGFPCIFSALNDTEFHSWILVLRKCIGKEEAGDVLEELLEKGQGFSEPCAMDNVSVTDAGPPRDIPGQRIGRGLGRAVQAAKGRLSTKASARGSEASPSSNDAQRERTISDDYGEVEIAENRGQRFRNKFSVVGQGAKRGLGTAFQAARQKGKQVADKGRQRMSRTKSNDISELEQEGFAEGRRGGELGGGLTSEIAAPQGAYQNLSAASEADAATTTFSDPVPMTSERSKAVRSRLGSAVQSVRTSLRREETPTTATTLPYNHEFGRLNLKGFSVAEVLRPDESEGANELGLDRIAGSWSLAVSALLDDPTAATDFTIIDQTTPSSTTDSSTLGDNASVLDRLVFTISASSLSDDKISVTSRRLHDVLALHAAISLSMAESIRSSASRAVLCPSRSLPVDLLRLHGTRLGGLLSLEALVNVSDEYLLYIGKTVSDFLNSVLVCNLPTDTVDVLSSFLQLNDAGREEGRLASPLSTELVPMWSPPDNEMIMDEEIRSGVVELLSKASSQVSQLHRLVALLQTNATKDATAPAALSGLCSIFCAQPFEPSAGLRTRTLEAMQERDACVARAAADNILHAHEVKALQRQVQTRDALIHSLKKDGNSVAPSMNSNQDEELMDLCQQLSIEIQSRTSMELEMKRLQDEASEKTNGEIDEVAELRRLREEMTSLKLRLAEQEARVTRAESEAQNWKQAHAEAFSM